MRLNEIISPSAGSRYAGIRRNLQTVRSDMAQRRHPPQPTQAGAASTPVPQAAPAAPIEPVGTAMDSTVVTHA